MWSNRPQGVYPQERRAAGKLMQAFEEARNRHTISRGDRLLVRGAASSDLNAANPFARIRWGNALWAEFVAYFNLAEGRPYPKVPLFWVTLADIGCFTAHDAKHISIAPFAIHLRAGLGGLSYVGMFDPAFYVNIAPGTNFAEHRGVNWHLHLFAWGESQKDFKARVAAMNASTDNYRPIVPGGQGAHYNNVTAETFAIKFRYMNKTPRKAYRVGRAELRGSEGEVDFKFKQNKIDLRPGERITLFHLLKGLRLDELTVAGGEGVALRRRALRQATRPSGRPFR